MAPLAFPDLVMNMTIVTGGKINIRYSYNEMAEGLNAPFEVPGDIIAANRTPVADAKLSDYIGATQAADGPLQLTFMNSASTQVWALNYFAIRNYFNFFDATVTTKAGFTGIMGLVEQVSNDLFLPNGTYSLWSRDQPDPVQTGKLPASNMYGTHPFYMAKASDDTWFGVFHNLAAAQDWDVKNNEDSTVSLKTIAAGGMADIFIFFGADPNELTAQYHTIVGNPVLTPQWALGWHQCRWGYHNTQALIDVVGNYSKYQLPLDTQWSDIDYMNNYEDFTFDPVNFAGLGDFVNDLHSKDMHYIPIVDAGVAVRSNNPSYTDGKDKQVFIKAANGEDFVGQVWPDDAAFPDYFAENTQSWWGNWLT